MENLRFVLFVLVFLGIYTGMHALVYTSVANGMGLSGWGRKALLIFFVLAALTFLFDIFLRRKFFIYPIAWTGAMWLGILGISFSVMAVKKIIDLILPGFLGQTTVAGLIIIFFLTAYSLYNASLPVRVKEFNTPLDGLPAELDGFSIVHLADLHLSRLKEVEWLKDIVKKVNGLNPDLIVITGDLIDEDAGNLAVFENPLRELKSKYGVIAVPGNHEYYAGIKTMKDLCRRTGIKLLINEKTTVAGRLDVIGLDDNEGRSFSDPMDITGPLLANSDKSNPAILLYHRPRSFEEAAEIGIDLQLSAHTHMGQLPPIDFIVWILFKYRWGLYRYGSSFIHTTSGTGTWGPRMRLFSHSEIVVIKLAVK
ncbi:MAG: metallophosphoesterase [Nitrospinota bacterium]